MRSWWIAIVVIGCGEPQRTVSNTTVVQAPHLPPCGFTDFRAFDAAAWKAAQTTQPRVGSCSLHAIDPRKELYSVRDGNVEIAKVTSHGTMMLVPGIAVAGFSVGMSSDEVLARHSPDEFRIRCFHDTLGDQCGFVPIGVEGNARITFAVDDDSGGRLDGIAAYEFFRGKTLRGVQGLTRLE